MKKEELIEKLNDRDAEIRLASLRELMSMIDRGELKAPVQGNDVNNHIHTTFPSLRIPLQRPFGWRTARA